MACAAGLERLIRSEMKRHKQHGDGHLIFKMNALEDAGMIRLLYEASHAGVEIDLIVRGVCSLRPGITGRQRDHSSAQHHWPVSGAQPHLLFP